MMEFGCHAVSAESTVTDPRREGILRRAGLPLVRDCEPRLGPPAPWPDKDVREVGCRSIGVVFIRCCGGGGLQGLRDVWHRCLRALGE